VQARARRARRERRSLVAAALLAACVLAGGVHAAERPRAAWRPARTPRVLIERLRRQALEHLERDLANPPPGTQPSEDPGEAPAPGPTASPDAAAAADSDGTERARSAPPQPAAAEAQPETLPDPGRPRPLRALAVLVATLAIVGAGFFLQRRRPATQASPPGSREAPPEAPAATRPVDLGTPIPATAQAATGAPSAVRPASGSAPDDLTTRPRIGPVEPLAARADAAVAAALAAAIEAPTLARPPAAPMPFPGGGRYEILGELGRGGMGVVYRARDKRLDRPVALKRLPENLRENPRAVELLLREARSAARLNHPHVVTVYDVDHDDGAYFITMELLEGQPLAALLRRQGRFATRSTVWLGLQIAAGLDYAHTCGVVHRDVKTGNVFVTRDRRIKIMDFGLAKMMEEVRRRATFIGGTPAYMAPEQSLGLAVDGRADLYALGATLFELLTGGVPFEAGDPLHHHRHTPPPDPRERTPDVPESLARLVLDLLAKRPEDRPASASEVGARLRAIERELNAPA
jgi:tRNA A-37 threonylcarbamoyl transferase component Bud32